VAAAARTIGPLAEEIAVGLPAAGTGGTKRNNRMNPDRSVVAFK